MASKALSIKFDLNAWGAGAAEQFRDLNPKEPGQWPLLPKLAAFFAVAAAAAAFGWFFVLADVQSALEVERNREPTLKEDYRG